jgi:hypothetical protein
MGKPACLLPIPAAHPQVAFGAALAGSSEDFRPQQAFLRLTSRDSGAAAFFAAVRAKDGSMYATAKSADVQKQVGVPWMPVLQSFVLQPCMRGSIRSTGQVPLCLLLVPAWRSTDNNRHRFWY